MSNPYIGQINLFGFNFAVRSWAQCDGQLIAISQNSALFSLLGTIYGGDGRTTFGLPDLRGRVAMHTGNGPGLTSRRLGEKSGQESVTLTTNEIPSHNHSVKATKDEGTEGGPQGKYLAAGHGVETVYSSTISAPNKVVQMASDMIGNQGGGRSHNNMQPYLVVNYQIAMFGIYPSRS